MFETIDDVRIPKPDQQKDAYLGDAGNGEYTVELVKAKYYDTQKDGKRFVFATVKVLTAPLGSTAKPGDKLTHSIPLFSKFKDTWQKELKFFVASWFGVAADDVDTKACELFVGDTQPATGKRAKVTVEKKDGKMFAKTRWRGAK